MKIKLTENQISSILGESTTGVFDKHLRYVPSGYQPVGKGGANNPKDVKYILRLFKCADVQTGIENKNVDYKAIGESEEFEKLISDFQKVHFGWSDGVIDKNKSTMQKLIALCVGEDEQQDQQIKSQSMDFSPSIDYNTVISQVIDNLEGGYYHPDMLKDGRIKDQRYAGSGETMFGIDRVAGGTINDTAAGKKFWSIIDKANARKNWNWGYRGGNLENKLASLAGQMIKPLFLQNMRNFMIPEAQKLVYSDPKLFFNFVYSTYNGSGWFKKFASKMNQAVQNGVTDTDKLFDIAMNTRLKSGNSLIKQGGKKIKALFN